MKMKIFEEVVRKIHESKNIVITTHLNPDGDGIGAVIALLLGLNKYIKNKGLNDKRIRVIIIDNIPSNLKFLFGSELIEKYENYNTKYSSDLLIALDTGTLERVGDIKNISKNISKNIINIDHHVSNTNYGIINYIDSKCASTCEIIYELLEFMDIEIDALIGEALYTGFINDTGNFKHSNVLPETFEKASKLIAAGVDNTKIIREFLDRKKYSALKLFGRALERANIIEDKKFIYTYISQTDFKEFCGDKFDTDGIVEFILQCDLAETSLFLREEENGSIKGSMRTKSDILDLNDIVGVFSGGGHKKAAGFSSKLSCQEIVKKIMEILEKIE